MKRFKRWLATTCATSDLTGDVPAGYVGKEGVLAGAIDTGTVPINACSRCLRVGAAEAGG